MTHPRRIKQTATSLYKVSRARKIDYPLDPELAQTLDDPEKALEQATDLLVKHNRQTDDTARFSKQTTLKIRAMESTTALTPHLSARADVIDSIGLMIAGESDKTQDMNAHKDFTQFWQGCCTTANQTQAIIETNRARMTPRAPAAQAKSSPSHPITPRRVKPQQER